VERRFPCVARGSSDSTLRLQCNSKSQVEFLLAELSMMFQPTSQHAWSTEAQAVYDRTIDGLLVQDKAAEWNSSTKSAKFTALVTKRMSGGHVPYEVGDLAGGFFVFTTVHSRLRLFLEWRIPERDMDQVFGALIRKDHAGTLVYPGCQQMNLSVLGTDGMNVDVHMAIFGRLPRKNTDSRAAQYLTVRNLPSNYTIHSSLEGRDPIVCV
jgi:hypothetical protein